ncbi:MAG: hypothetical protein ACRD96_18555, partial [Bryobacteraceae bacterium]
MRKIAVLMLAGAGAIQAAEVPAGTRFLVELSKKLEAKKTKPGKKFDARTLEALRGSDGRMIPAGAKLTGRVTHAEHDKLILRFERIEAGRTKTPIVASVVGVAGEKNVRRTTSDEAEIRASGGRGKGAAVGAVVLGGIGAAVGASQ